MSSENKLNFLRKSEYQIIKNTIKATISTATIVQPTGVAVIIEIAIPVIEHIPDNIAEHIVTNLNVLNILIADKAGKIIRAEISNEPTKVIAKTITTAIFIEIIVL